MASFLPKTMERTAWGIPDSILRAQHKGLVTALKQCTKTKDLEAATKLHLDAVAAGWHTDKYIASALINMYIKCNCIRQAREVFDNTLHRDVVTWNCLILGYVENGESSVALELLTRMECAPSHITYVAALKACSDLAVKRVSEKHVFLEKGIAFHRHAKNRGLVSNLFVANSLLDMYGKCGSTHLARDVFEKMTERDVVTWNSLIMGYVENGESPVAMDLFTNMDCEPNNITYIGVLKACAGMAVQRESDKESLLEKGRDLDRQIKHRGFHTDIIVATTLVDMYCKCGSTHYAWDVFHRMVHRNVVAWNCFILGYVENGEISQALDLFSKIDCEPDALTYVAALKACAGLSDGLEKGIEIHTQLKDCGYDSNKVVATTLIDMYAKCGIMQRARDVFDGMSQRDIVSWNCLIIGYVENGESLVALDLFHKLHCEPDHLTYVAALKACASLASERVLEKQRFLEKGIAIHRQLKDGRFDSNIVVATTLLDMYFKCGSMQHALEVFNRMAHKNVVTWNCLILGYVENGESSIAVDMFFNMDCEPNCLTFIAALKAFAAEKESCLEKGIEIHKQLKDRGLDSNKTVLNSLLDMYGKCGKMQYAREVFQGVIHKDVVMWNCLILGYVENGESSVAMDFFTNMDCEPDSFTYAAVLKACGELAALPSGKCIHTRVCKLGLEQEQVVANGLVNLYGKCGSKHTAEVLFHSMQSPDIVTWKVLMSCRSSVEVFDIGQKIREAGLQMDEITFIYILTACSHEGLLEHGRMYMKSMLGYGLSPGVEHYNCIVDMLGRANRLEEALCVVYSMPCKPNSVTWKSLLAACRKWNNLQVGKVAFDALVACDGKASAGYIMMADIYKD